ncbi:MAG: flagellar motor switch protein FliG [Candidatus Bruticola sp.]
MSVNLPPKQKTAILLMSLPPEASAEIFKELGPEEVQAITTEISKLPQISPETRAQVIQEFLNQDGGDAPRPFAGLGQLGHPMGGPGSLGGPPPMSSFTQTAAMSTSSSNRPLDFLRRVDPRQLLQLIRKEHPQTIAVILSYLQPSQASAVLSDLQLPTQTEVAKRLAELHPVNAEILTELEKVLESRLHQALEEGSYSNTDGKEALLEILSQADRGTEERVLSGLATRSPQLVTNLKTKLCDFEDLNNVDDPSLEQVLRLTDFRDLVLALKGADENLSKRVYRFLSPDVAQALRDDIASLVQVSWDEIKQAQQRIRNILRGLVTLGKIKFR